MASDEETSLTDTQPRGQWALPLIGLLVLICCLCLFFNTVLMPRAGLPGDYRATICLSLYRNPWGVTLWWTSPNLTSLPHQPLMVSNRIQACLFSTWLPLLSSHGGFDLR